MLYRDFLSNTLDQNSKNALVVLEGSLQYILIGEMLMEDGVASNVVVSGNLYLKMIVIINNYSYPVSPDISCRPQYPSS